MKNFQSSAIFLLVLFGVFFVSGLSPVRAHEEAEAVVIHMDEKGFSPREVVITKGEKITFENVGTSDRWPASNIHPTHGIYPDSNIRDCGTEKEKLMFDACRNIKPGESWSFVFEHVGTWRLHDHLNARLTGVITVTESEQEPTVSGEPEPSPSNEGPGLWQLIIDFFKRIFSSVFGSGDSSQNIAIAADDQTIFSDEKQLELYMKKYGVEKTVTHLHELSATLGNCHTIAHEAGRIAYELFEEQAFRQCAAYCHSGCYHGATEAYFKDKGTANLAGNLKMLCGDELNSFFNHQCIHGIGHGLMAWTDYELPDALKSCDLLPQGQSSCWTGVFMENIVGGLAKESSEEEQKELAGHFTEYLNDDPQYPCTVVEEQYKGSCYFLQTSRMIQLFKGDFNKVAQACGQAPATYQRSCFESMGRDVGGTFRANPPGAIKACSGAPAGEPRIWCLTGAVQDSFWDPSGQDLALSFCAQLADKAEKDACYGTIFARAPQVLNSKDDLKSFCKKPEAAYQEFCARTVGI